MLIANMVKADLCLIVDNLGVSRAGRSVVSGISFELKQGQGLLVTGPNGSGKSTLLRAIAGLLPLDEGAAFIAPARTPVWAEAHFLNTANAMKSALSVAENLHFHQQFGVRPGMSVHDALGGVDLVHTKDSLFGDLSTGQKRRVALARLLLNERPLWLMDEPTTGLDKSSEDRFVEIIADHLGTGGIVVAATHLPIEVPGMKSLRFEAAAA